VSLAPERPRQPSIPFIGVAEALVLSAFKRKGLSLQKIRAALGALERETKLSNVLANKSLYTAGAEILWEYSRRSGDTEVQQLVEPGTGQRVFVPVVRDYLELITYGSDLWASQLELPAYGASGVVIDLHRGFGRPILDRYRLRVDEITDRFFAGDSMNSIAEDLEISVDDVENVIRVAGRTAQAAA
jgi:uncharacterized protein (DUF433 family)